MKIRVTQLDGRLPNLALMRLAAWHRAEGDEVHFERSPLRILGEPPYDRVYASAIFTKTAPAVEQLRLQFDPARTIIGGTGVDPEIGPKLDVDLFVPSQFTTVDYAIAPRFTASLGFTQRGCRFKCKFCVVPGKEGRPVPAQTIAQIWRGDGHPRKIHLLDNDFFGSPLWEDRIAEIRAGGFRVCINQGVNVRVISDRAAAALASIEYRDDSFRRRRLYTAWDSLGDERVFFRGVDRLEQHGVPPTHLMAYMLIGFAKDETEEALLYRLERMKTRGILPYAMTYQPPQGQIPLKRLLDFERWVNTGLYRVRRWDEYDQRIRARNQPDPDQPGLI
jgi:hypothetical protein